MPPKPVPSAPRQRESLDGETIFAVGEDADKWPEEDGGDDDEEEEEGEASHDTDETQKLQSKDD